MIRSSRLGKSGAFAVALIGGVAATASGQIRWRNEPPAALAPAAAPLAALTEAQTAGERHVVVQLDAIASDATRQQLRDAGVTLQGWLGSNAYFAVLAETGVNQAALQRAVQSISFQRIQSVSKLHPILTSGERPDWAIVPPPENENPEEVWIAAYVMFHPDVATNRGLGIAVANRALIVSHLFSVNGMVIELPLNAVVSLAREDGVMYVEPALPPFVATNDSNRNITGANIVQAAPYGLTGAGVNVLVYDAGFAMASHLDFQGRLTVRDSSGVSTHATHVSGTIGGAGIGNAAFKGMAPGVTIQSYGFEQEGGLHEGFLYTDPGDLEADYGSAINTHGAVISNNSIGTNTAPNGFPCSWEGDYGVTSALIDSIVRGSLGNTIRIVWANGNERGSGRCGTTYHTTAPPACAKNHITVGALNSNDDSVTNFTSWGPTDDGRLKPDISAPGCQSNGDFGVTSCSTGGNNSYISFCGTSMASPTVCGLSALVMQDFRTQFPGRPDLLNSTLKTLWAHNAQDIEAVGPDYKTGYGSVRVQPTIDFMRTGQFVEESVENGGVYRVTMVALEDTPFLKITLAWDDPAAAPVVVGTIVNDLDIVVRDPAGTQHFPWTLGGLDNPSAPAVRTQADHVNNIEQVYVADPMPGVWVVEIRGFAVPVGPQAFSACFSPSFTGDCNLNNVNDLEDIANGTSQDCNENSIPDECESQDDCNENGVLDFCDIHSGTSLDRNLNRVPDECDPDCNGNGTPDAWDVTSGLRPDCNGNGTPDDWDVTSGLRPDCNGNILPDECDIAAGTSDDCNSNAIPDECDTDCNNNNSPDDCDIASGTSPDCNGNGIPDSCDIASGFSRDCNNNGVPDTCDIANGTSHDCTGNGIPDDCEADCNLNGIADDCDIANGTSLDENGDGFPDECNRLYVNDNATGGGTGARWQDAFTTVSAALSHAQVNLGVNEIWVAAGTYRPPTGGFIVPTGMKLYGGFAGTETTVEQRNIAANPTLLAATNQAPTQHILSLTSTAAGTIVDGFVVSRGTGSGAAIGGGILVAFGSATIRNCTFSDNTSGSGAGAFAQGAIVSFTDCVFSANIAQTGDGGAVGTGGVGTLNLTRCRFNLNIAREIGANTGRGGAVFVAPGYTANINACVFDGNAANNNVRLVRTEGGAIANNSLNTNIRNSTFIRNVAGVGGGLRTTVPIAITNCVFTGNKASDPNIAGVNAGDGGAVFADPGVPVTLNLCTIAANWAQKRAGGASIDGAFNNAVLWHNVVPPQGGNPVPTVAQQYQGTVAVRYSDVAGLLNGGPPDPAFPGSIEGNPLFVVAPSMTVAGAFTAGDLHLVFGSPCVDAGENATIPASATTDLDGLLRRFDDLLTTDTGAGTSPLVDMGAYERQVAPCPGDLTGERTVDLSDLAILLANFGNVGAMTYADGDFDGDADVDLQDLATLLSHFGESCP